MKKIKFKQMLYEAFLGALLFLGLNGLFVFIIGGRSFITSMNEKFNLDGVVMYFGYACLFITCVAITWFALAGMMKLNDGKESFSSSTNSNQNSNIC